METIMAVLGCQRWFYHKEIKAINRKPVGEFHNFLLVPGVSTLFSNWVTCSLLSQHSS